MQAEIPCKVNSFSVYETKGSSSSCVISFKQQILYVLIQVTEHSQIQRFEMKNVRRKLPLTRMLESQRLAKRQKSCTETGSKGVFPAEAALKLYLHERWMNLRWPFLTPEPETCLTTLVCNRFPKCLEIVRVDGVVRPLGTWQGS